jgi:hypothetical protein
MIGAQGGGFKGKNARPVLGAGRRARYLRV